MSMAAVEHSEESDELMRLRRLVRAVQGALGTEEDGSALVDVARNSHTAELQNAKWAKVFEERCSREEQLVWDSVKETCEDVLQKLAANGIDTSGCDGDDDPVTILCHWIETEITTERSEKIVWAADALNCRQAIAALLKFHPESPETGAELPPEAWTADYRRAVTYAKRCLSAGGGGGFSVEQPPDEEKRPNH